MTTLRMMAGLLLLGLGALVASVEGAHSEAELSAAATKYFETFNTHEASAVAKLYTSDGHFFDWSMRRGEPTRTRGAVLAVVSGIFEHVPAIHSTVRALHVAPESDTVAVELFVHAQGLEKKSNFMTVVDVLQFDDELLLTRCHRYKMHDWTVFFHRAHKFGTIGAPSDSPAGADVLRRKALAYFEAFNAHDAVATTMLFAATPNSDGLLHDWNMDPNNPAKSRAAVQAALEGVFADVPAIHAQVQQLHVAPGTNAVAAELRIFPAGKAADAEAFMTVVDVLEFNDEQLLTRCHAYKMHDAPEATEQKHSEL